MGTSNNNSTLLARPINPSMDVGFNNPSKQQDSIYSDNMSTYRQYQTQAQQPMGTLNDSLMLDSASMMPQQNMVNTDAFTQMTQ